jgi:ABC-type lipoprotein export system ATPase subunit
VLQALHLVAHLSVRDNLRLAQYLAHLPQDDCAIDDSARRARRRGKASSRRPSSRRASSSAWRSRAPW